ncbi:MAG TPA: DNA/RNA non-specific endonuclease [Myxococcales bacterium]|nr:DNA/RNA non-specific endonuclease [Myxococcales bacterium]
MHGRAFLLLSAFLCAGCGPQCEDERLCPAAADRTAPSIAIEDPAPGARVAGPVRLRAVAGDASGISAVDFAVDGTVVATATGAPWTVSWDSLSVDNGAHRLGAVAHDRAGNVSASAPLPISVLNRRGAAISVHTALGLPGSSSVTAPPPYLSVKPQYVVSYDGGRRVPAWVSWELNAGWLGPVPRQDDFRADDTLPPDVPQAQLADYAGSGWDRGHLCPSEDRTATIGDNRSTFYLTNMVPQADNVNGGPWARLESYLRGLASGGKELSVVAGGIFAGTPRTIGADAVAVPAATFKVAVVLDGPGQGIADVTAQTRVIAVVMPNDPLVLRTADWRAFRVRPREVESLSGLRLFPDLPHELRDLLFEQVDSIP